MFKARDFVLTHEGLGFAVTLNGIEDGRVIACLRYTQDAQGTWHKVNTERAEALLRRRYPHYLHYASRRDVVLQAVPVEAIAVHLKPRRRLQELIRQASPAPLIARLQSLVACFETLGLSRLLLGITGSLLLGQYTERSDLDLVVYGREAFSQARQALRQAIALGYLQELDPALWQESYARRGCALSFAEYLWHERRKHTKGAILGTKFDLILVEEENEEPDSRSWRKLGRTVVRAKVLDATRAFSTPACYLLDHPRIAWALSFSATYVGQAEAGEWVEIAGFLEQAADGEQRIVVGSSREAPLEYIKVIQPQRYLSCSPSC
ncbi:nucleotidyltransferase [Methylothermus subterraneus]